MVLVYIGWGILQRHNKHLADRVHDLEKRVGNGLKNLQRRKASLDYNNKQKQILERLRPKLELIGFRLAKMEGVRSSVKSNGDENDSKNYCGLEIDGKSIKFDARSLFAVLDADLSGDVTFDELNVILGLTEIELQEFIRRMNEMADLSSSKTSVTQPVFVKYFLQVLSETSNLTISYEEAELIFNEMAGSSTVNEIDMQLFYTSSMSVSY